jgi:hypothetical protein
MNSIHDICKRYGIENYIINPDGSIDVDGDVDLSYKDLTELPLTFNRVYGDFRCIDNKLTSLKGSPRWIGDSFNFRYNNLTSLEFSPRWVGGYFNCDDNLLTSLEFGPDYVGDYFSCVHNDLIDNYCDTEIDGRFYTSLEQDGLILNLYDEVTNYKDFQKLYKRKKILNDIFNM